MRADYSTGHSGTARSAGPGIQSDKALSIRPWIPGPPAEFIIGPRFARTRWRASRNDEMEYA